MTKMPQQITDDRKKQMRQNIIKHRQTLFQYLESINDTVLKPKIKLNLSDSEKLNLNTKSKKKSELKNKSETNLNNSKQIPRLEKVKEESIDIYSENSDDFLSVGSNEEWFSSYSTSDEIDVDSRRRPAKQDINNKWNDEKKNARKYICIN